MTDSQIIGRVKITGELVLESPLLIGDGAGETSENSRDIHVLKNQDDVPFIPGTSICGVLRDEFSNSATLQKLFGDPDNFQSAIQIDDVQLTGGEIISRDGVKIDGVTGTGVDGGKYDYEAVERGALGTIQILINLRGCHAKENFKAAISELLGKLQSGIRIGALTSKGFGKAKAQNLNAQFYNFQNKADVIAWLTDKSAAETLKPAKIIPADFKNFVVDAKFNFNSSFIVRDYEIGATDKAQNISAVTLKSRQDFVIPGTSWKGIFRHRAEYIFSRVNLDAKLLDNLMGTADGDKIKSRFIVSESYIAVANFNEFAHVRNKIDRFTGGTLQGTLFTTKPAYQKNSAAPTLDLHFEIRNAKTCEAALAIFLLRDLWLGNVAVGGEKSIGRGTLQGVSATINYDGKTYQLGANGKVTAGDKETLSEIAATLKDWSDNL